MMMFKIFVTSTIEYQVDVDGNYLCLILSMMRRAPNYDHKESEEPVCRSLETEIFHFF